MSFEEWSNNKKKKKSSSFEEWSNANRGVSKQQEEEDEKKRQAYLSQNKSKEDDDIAPVREDTEERTWFKDSEGSLWDTILGSGTDLLEHASAGLMGIGEKITDAAVSVGSVLNRGNMMQAAQNELTFNLMTGRETEGVLDKYQKYIEEGEKEVAEFVAKDLYDEEEIAKRLISDNAMKIGVDSEKNSVFGAKSDDLAMSAGQLGGQLLVSAIPGVGQAGGMAMLGATAFGSEAENALKEGATLNEAMLSATISAGAELLSEKLGGVKFGGKTLTDTVFEKLSGQVTSKLAKILVSAGKIGTDAIAEGGEELFSGYMSAVGQKLSYMKDKEIEELFSDEDKLESFIGGVVLGGTFGTVETAVSGRDAASGLNKSEQAVVDKVVEDAVAEKEKGGTPLTNREKAKIRESVVDQMEKGQIDIDTIESVLGGDAYKSYKETVDSEDSLKTELSELRKMKSGDMNDIQTSRMAELKEMNLDDTTKRDGLRKALDDKISPMLKGSKLTESYRERERRGQAFEADLSKYTGKQREAVERAVKSGVLNNTYRSHELVDVLSKIEADKGIAFDYTNNKKLQESGFAVEGKTVNGYANKAKGSVTLNVQSSKAWQSVVGHEITHILEGTDSYNALRNALYEYAESKGELASRRDTLTSLYNGMDADIENELAADLVGEYLFTDKDFINKLTGNRTLFQKVYDEIKYLWNAATGKEKTEIEKVKSEFDKAWKELSVEAKEAEGKVQLSVSEIVDENNNSYGMGVKLDSTLLDDLTPDERVEMVKERVKELGGKPFTAYDGNGNAVNVMIAEAKAKFKNKNGKIIPVNKDLTTKYIDNETKQEAVVLADELILTAKYEDGKAPVYPHGWLDNNGKNNWEYWTTYVQDKNNTIWQATLNIATTADGEKILYDVSPIKKAGRSVKSDTLPADNSIAPLPENVNTQFSVSVDSIAEKYKDKTDYLFISERKNGTISIDNMVVKEKYRNQGVGTSILNDVISYADANGKTITLTPTSEFGTKAKLTKWYKANGFVENKGKNADFTLSDTMYRLPKKGVQFSLSPETVTDSNGNELSIGVQKRFANSKAVDENGNLKVLYHGTYAGEFYTFDKSKGSVEGDFGSGFYFTDSEQDVETNYEDGGPDFENKVARLAERIEAEEDIEYQEAQARAREELYKGGHKFEVYLNIENPAIVGETILFDPESYYEQYDRGDYDSEEDYEDDVEQYIADDIEKIIWDIERNTTLFSTDGIADVLWNAIDEGGVDIEQLKANINELYLEDDMGNFAGNEATRQIIESLGYDGIIDPTVSGKWNMDMEEGTTHYIVFKPNQIKDISNQNPTDNPDIRKSLSNEGEQFAPVGNYSTPLKDLALEEDIAPVAENVAPTTEAPFPNEIAPMTEEEANAIQDEKAKADAAAEGLPKSRKQLHNNIINDTKATFSSNGFDFDDVLAKAKNLSTFSTVDNTPQRVMEKALGYKEGQVLADLTVNKVAQNEAAGIKWLNSFTDRKNGVLAQLSRQYRIKPGSKESAAAQMYAEGFYVNDNNDIIAYGDAELAKDFPDKGVQNRIKGLARDPRIRQIYDDTLNAINDSRTRNAYPEIQRLENYFLHFRAMDDTFSKLGLPFNPNDIRAKDLPTDLNGVTADLKPGQPYFASAMHRTGKRTSFDLLGGLERYLTSAKNQIYHIDDIQTLRALRNYIADTYGQANGLEGIDALTEEEAQEKIEQVYGSHLSTFAKFLNEEANVLAGKTALIDRGLEGIIGRRGMTFLDTVNRQVGSNMVGFNISSSLTNFLPVAQTFAKTNKFDFTKAFAQTVSNKISSVFGKNDGFTENSPVAIRRKGADRFYRTPWQKAGDAGYFLMSAVDDVSTELIARTKFNELTRKGMDEQTAHFETDKWVSRLMGDRSLGQQPQLYNSKTLGVFTKFQLEVRNQLDSQFYDTIQEAKVSNEDIHNALARNAKTAAKVTSTFAQLAVVQHLYGVAFESVAGYNPAFDIISTLATMFGFDDDEESEDTVLDNIEQGFLELLEDLPYTSTFTGGRIPISSALPVTELIKGVDQYGNKKSRLETIKGAAPYFVLPGGYGQGKKTVAGLNMFSDEHPVSGSYTDSGKLRFPVEKTPLNVAQAAVFGQYASKNAREYFDNGYAPLSDKQTKEYIDVDIPISEYRDYREGLKGLDTNEEKFDYISGLDLPVSKKNILVNNVVDRKEPVDLENYEDFSDYEEFDFATKNPEKWDFLQENGISYDAYNESEETREAYNWAYKNPEGYAVSKAITEDVVTYRRYTSDLYDIKADKDENGKSISGSRKEKVLDYINNLDADYYTKIILWKSEYPSDDTYNGEIVNFVNNHSDLSYEERVAILTKLGFRVDENGNIYVD